MSTSALPLKPQVFAILSALIEERSGLHYDISDLDILADKLSARAIEAGFDSLLDYYYYLRYDASSAPEFDALLDSLVVNETYFFREFDSLQRMVSDVVAPLVAAGKRPRLWCAAASTGEEPFTLAMLLAESALLDRVDLLASDVSTRVLARAQAGEYSQRSLRQRRIDGLRERWLHEEDGRVRVADELRKAIRWQRVNLVDTAAVAALGTFDLILCRNVLIYFRDRTATQVIATLTAALEPSGVLLVGVSESLLRFGTSLCCEERGGVFFYRRER